MDLELSWTSAVYLTQLGVDIMSVGSIPYLRRAQAAKTVERPT